MIFWSSKSFRGPLMIPKQTILTTPVDSSGRWVTKKKHFSILQIAVLEAKDVIYLSYKSSKSLCCGVVDSVVQLSSTINNFHFTSQNFIKKLIQSFQFWKQSFSINNVKSLKISPSSSLVVSDDSIAENFDHSKLEVIASPTIVGEISMISSSV